MKLKSVEIENYRAIEKLKLSLDPSLTVLHGDNGYGKTSVLSAIAVGLGHEDMLGSYLDISTIDLCKEDWREGKGYPRVVVEDTNGNIGERRGDEVADELKERNRIARKETMQPLLDKALATEDKELPIVAFYGTERTFSDMPDRVLSQRGLQFEPSRRAALEEALSARTDFKGFLAWFSFKEHEELRRLKYQLDSNYQLEDLDYHLKDLSAVRQAISSMLPEVSEPRTESNPSRFVVSHKSEQGQVEKLSLDQLSGGYRIVLALAADLARRMAQGNPHLDDPLKSEAVVLIDEVELHLHPAWQQRILGDLQRTFPNAQFIVSTHSPQVLTTVEPQRIVKLYWEDDRIVAGAPEGATYGAEAGDVLSLVMGVNERPDNDFTKDLDKYRRLVSEGKGESEEALALRRKLEELSDRDYALTRADLEIKQRKLFKQMAESQ